MAQSVELLIKLRDAEARQHIDEINKGIQKAQQAGLQGITLKADTTGATQQVAKYNEELGKTVTLSERTREVWRGRGSNRHLETVTVQTREVKENYAQIRKEAERAAKETERLAQATQRARSAFSSSLSGDANKYYQRGAMSEADAINLTQLKSRYTVKEWQEIWNEISNVTKATKIAESEVSIFGEISDSAFERYSTGAMSAARAMTELKHTASPSANDWQSMWNTFHGIGVECGVTANDVSVFGRLSDEAFAQYSSGAMSADAANESLRSSTKSVGEEAKQTGKNTQEAGEKAQKTSKAFVVLTSVLIRLAHTALSAVTRSFREALTEMKNVDTQLTTISRITQTNISDLDALKNKAYEVGNQYGVLASDYLSAAAAFTRAGYRDQAEDLAELSSKMQIAGQVSAETANQLLIATDKAYGFNGSVTELSAVMDKMTIIDHNYATSVEKIAEGIGLVAPIASQAHMSMDELIAAMGTITAVTQRSGSESARALRALILSIIKDTTTEIDEGVTWTVEEINTLQDALKMYAPEVVKAAEATGSLIDPMEAIAALSKAFDEGLLTEAKLAEITSKLGGKLRSSQLLSLIQNYSGMYTQMMADMGNAIGAVDNDVDKALQSWEVKLNQLKNNFAKFVQDSLSSEMIKGLIDGVNWLISGFGNLGTVIGIVSGAFVALNITRIIGWFTNLGKSVTALGGGFKNLILVLTNYKTASQAGAVGTNAFNTALEGTSIAASVAQIAITALAVAISAAIIAYNKIDQSQKEKAEASEKLAKATGEESKRLDELYQRYLDAKDGSEQQKDASKELREALDLEAGSVENLSDKYKELTAEKRKQSVADYYDSVLDKENLLRRNLNPFTSIFGAKIGKSSKIDLNNMFNDPQSGAVIKDMLGIYAGDWNEIFAKYNKAESNAKNLIGLYTDINALLEKMKVAREKGDSVPEQGFNILKNWATQSEEYVNAYEDSWKSYVQAKAYEDAWNDSTIKNIKTQEDFDSAIKKASQSGIKGYGDAMKVVLEQMFPQFVTKTEDATEAVEEQADSVDELTEKLNGATDALNKYKNALEGGEKGDTFKSMADAYKNAVELFNKGLTGSNAYMSAIDLLIGSGFADTYEEAGKLLGNKFINAMFEGGGDDFGANAANYIRNHLSEFEGVAIKEANDGTFSLIVEDMEAFSRSAQVSEESLWALMGALDAYDSTTLDGTKKTLDDIEDAPEVIEKKVDVDNSELYETQGLVDALNDSEIKIKVSTRKSFVSGGGNNDKNIVFESQASGTNNSTGGATLVNEEGAELIYANGRAWVAGSGKPTITNLPKGAGVFNAQETRDILSRSGIPSLRFGERPYRTNEGTGQKTSDYSAGGIPNDDYSGKKPQSNPQNSLEQTLDSLEKYVEKILKKAKEALDAQLKAIDEQIDALEREHNAEEDKNKLEELRLKVLEAEKRLVEAQNERTVRYFNKETGQWEWMADQKAVADAEKALKDAKDAYDKEVSEQAYQAQIQALQDIKQSLKDQYNDLADHWEEIVNALQETSEDGVVDIESLLKKMGLDSDTTGSIRDLIKAIQDYEKKLADGTYEVPLDSETTEKLLGISGMTSRGDSTLSQMFGITTADTNARGTSLYNMSTSNVGGDTNYYINGINIGSDMLNMTLSQLLSVLPIYANAN